MQLSGTRFRCARAQSCRNNGPRCARAHTKTQSTNKSAHARARSDIAGHLGTRAERPFFLFSHFSIFLFSGHHIGSGFCVIGGTVPYCDAFFGEIGPETGVPKKKTFKKVVLTCK